jgi:hypothetical protein
MQSIFAQNKHESPPKNQRVAVRSAPVSHTPASTSWSRLRHPVFLHIFHKSDFGIGCHLRRRLNLTLVRDAIARLAARPTSNGRRANCQISPRISNATSDNQRLFLQHKEMLMFVYLVSLAIAKFRRWIKIVNW